MTAPYITLVGGLGNAAFASCGFGNGDLNRENAQNNKKTITCFITSLARNLSRSVLQLQNRVLASHGSWDAALQPVGF